MSDEEIYNKACDRLEKANGFKRMSHREIIVELEKEIDVYREKIEKLKSRLNSIYGTSRLEAVQENTVAEIIKALSDNGYNTITVNCYKDIESEV